MASLYFATTEAKSRKLSLRVKQGALTRIHRGIYTDANNAELERLLHSKWYQIVDYLFPTAIAAYRTAHELIPSNGTVFVVADNVARRKVKIGATLTIDLQSGNTSDLVEPFILNLARSSFPRQCLENLSVSRSKIKKSLGREWVEEKLSNLLNKPNGEEQLNKTREQARKFSEAHELSTEFDKLNTIISSLLSTHPDGGDLISPLAIATAKKLPFDINRIKLFATLADYLSTIRFKPVPYTYNKSGWKNLSFFESYFSNYIEGTEFEIDEAEDIIFKGATIGERHQDSHDVKAVFSQVNDYQDMSMTPNSVDDFIETLQRRHYDLMEERPEKRPGQFKQKINKAGSSIFVSPGDLVGTLIKAFDIYQTVPKGLESAIFIHFVLSECHPFDDGNGRLSRIMMNAELHAMEQHKIIAPTVHRDSYLNGLRLASRQNNFKAMVKVFYQLQQYTSFINWVDYAEAREMIEEHCAHLPPDEGIATFNRVLRQFKYHPPAH